MARATMQQRAERMETARDLVRHHSPAEATRLLAERYSLSSGQARRYVRATADASSLARAATKDPVTVRIPRPLLARLRTRARRTGRSLGALMTQAVANWLDKTPD